jgi:hypothetical protein
MAASPSLQGTVVKWVIRERPKIDRIACPWLIRRFIDQDAEILYVPTADVLRVAQQQDAIPFDVPGVELTHDGPRCSFDAILKKYGLDDAALARLATIVRASDTDTLDLSPQMRTLDNPVSCRFTPKSCCCKSSTANCEMQDTSLRTPPATPRCRA